MAKAMTQARKKGQRKAAVELSVSAHSPIEPPGDKNWRAESIKRLKSEITALEKELQNFDAAAAAAKVRSAAELELRRKKLRLEEHQLEMGGLDG